MRPAQTKEGRILFVDHAGMLGGAQLSLLDIAFALRSRGAVALFEDGPFAKRLVGEGIALIPIESGSALRSVKKSSRIPSVPALLATARTVLAVARTARPFDVLYANSPKSFLISAAASLLVRRPVIWHLRDILDVSHFSDSNIRVMIRVTNRLAARVIANSHATADAFVAAGGRRELVVVVHNGIDARPFKALDEVSRADTRRTLGFSDDDFVVGSFSRLHPWKGPQILLDAMELLVDERALLVGGALFSGEEDFERELTERARRPPLSGRVQLLGARSDVPRLINACDVVAHTSIAPEPFGRVIVEALLAGRPVIAADDGGVREVVTDGVTALLTRPGDAMALANAIHALRADPARARALASAGRADVGARFSLAALVAGVTRVVDDVLAGSRA